MNLHQIILRPLVTEKCVAKKETSQTLAFEVAVQANKVQIKNAVEKLFKVKVAEVRTANQAGKLRRRGRFAGIAGDGSGLAIDTNANETFYAKPGISANEIFGSPPCSSPAVERLKNFLGKSASTPAMQ